MNRRLPMLILLAALGAGRNAVAQDAAPAPALTWDAFKIISQNNIFDQSRTGPSLPGRARPKITRRFTLNGTIDDEIALFSGDGAGKGYLKCGESIDGFKLVRIPLRYTEPPAVLLAGPDGTNVVLQQDETLQQEEDGPWIKSDQPAPVAASASGPETTMPSSASSAPASGSLNDILEKLRKRKLEEK